MRPRTRIPLPAMILVAAAMALPWISAADHSLYSPDEGRYATVAQHMADGDGWLVPLQYGHSPDPRELRPHLTKPPLVYWLQAVGLRVLGHGELAIRWPSLVATSLAVVLVFWTGTRVAGARTGLVAAALLAVMPLHLLVGRLGTTDALLACAWLATLAFGHAAVERRSTAMAAAIWTAVAIGLLAKGPLALVPVVVLLVWLALGRRFGEVRHLHPLPGLALALIPLAAWAFLVARHHEPAWDTWREEVLQRFAGSGRRSHAQPPWFYLPVLLAGFYPATVMLALPGLHHPWRAAWHHLRRGSHQALWSLAILLPLAMFTLMAGKLATYLLPLAGPTAILAACMLVGWMSDEAPAPGTRRPEVRRTLAITSLLLIGVVLGGGWWIDPAAVPMVIPLVVAPMGGCLLWAMWRRGAAARLRAFAWAWVAAALAWGWLFRLENLVLEEAGTATAVRRVHDLAGTDDVIILNLGFYPDPAIEFYSGTRERWASVDASAWSLLQPRAPNEILLADARQWNDFALQHSDEAARWEHLGDWWRWFNRPTLILRPPTPAPTDDATQ